MRILQVIDIAYEAGGAETSVKLMRDAMRQDGHEVMVLSTDKNAAGREVFADVMVPVVAGNALVRLAKFFWYGASYRAMRRAIKSFSPDVIHLHTISEFSPSVVWATGSVPTVLTLHGPEDFTLRLLPWLLPAGDFRGGSYAPRDLRAMGRLRLLYFRLLQRPAYLVALRRLKLAIAPSLFMAKAIEPDFRHTRIEQVYNGIRMSKATPLPARGPVTILYAGRLEPVKGVDHLVRAFAQIHQEFPACRLRIVGDGSHRAELEALARKLGVDAQVDFAGWVKQGLIAHEYAAATIVAVPSVWPENLPTVAIEALAVGRPLVGSKTGGIPELIENGVNGFVVEPGNADELAGAILRLLRDPKLLERAAVASAEKSRMFDQKPFITKLLELYNEASK